MRASRIIGQVLVLLAGIAAPAAAEGMPTAVSPGEGSRMTVAPSACPAFSWTAVPSARAYEIAVYQVGAESESPRVVLKRRLPSGATNWTPSLGQCLSRGERYGWSVRALEARGATEWSPPSLFKVAPGPTEAELEAALEIVRSYVDTRGTNPSRNAEGTLAGASSPNDPDRISGSDPAQLGPPPPGTQMTVDGNLHASSFTGDGSSLSGVATIAHLGTHATDASAHHAPTVDTNCHGNPCDGSALTGLNGDQLVTGTVLEPRIDDALARDSELAAAIAAIDLGEGTSISGGGGVTIPDGGPATPYPSILTIASFASVLSDLNVTLEGLTHDFPADLDILIVAPTGQTALLMSDAGGHGELAAASLTFDDEAGQVIPYEHVSIASGSYGPSDYGGPGTDVFPAPAPQGPHATNLSVFDGINPVGDWELYVLDDVSPDGGSLSSWSLQLNSSTTSVSRGGTGATSAAGARANLGAAAAVDFSNHEADPSAHHSRYTDAEAQAAVGFTGECEGFAVGGRRFIDRGDGTVRDCNTGKIWLRDAACLGSWPWSDPGDTIFTKINDLSSAVDFSCGEYVAGTYTDWEVPDIATLEGVVDSSISGTPKVYNGKGDAAWTPGNAFLAIQGALYWSATEVDPTDASCVGMNNGSTFSCVKSGSQRLWPVRSD